VAGLSPSIRAARPAGRCRRSAGGLAAEESMGVLTVALRTCVRPCVCGSAIAGPTSRHHSARDSTLDVLGWMAEDGEQLRVHVGGRAL
jgi:hypothetical protein